MYENNKNLNSYFENSNMNNNDSTPGTNSLNPPVSSITNETNTAQENSQKNNEILEKKTKSYHCKYCYGYQKLKMKLDKTEEDIDIKLKVKCIDEEDNNKSLKIFMKYRITEIRTEEEIRKLKCQKDGHNNKEYKYFCHECNKNLCEDCYNECKKKHNDKVEDFINLEEEIKEKKQYIDNFFKNEYKDEKQNYSNKKGYQTEIKKDEKIGLKVDNKGIIGIINKGENNDYLNYKLNLKELYEIIVDNKTKFPNFYHFENIKEIYSFILDKLEIEYSLNNINFDPNQEINIQLFGENFVKNNKNNCSLIINEQRKELCEKYKIPEEPKDGNLKIILVKEKPIENVSEMFNQCKDLLSLQSFNQWTMDKVTNMKKMFYECISLKLIDLNGWNTSQVKDFSYMFYSCQNLEIIEGLNNFNTQNAENFGHMFDKCYNLNQRKFDVSHWNTGKVTNMMYIFSDCWNIKKLDLSNWKIENVTEMNCMFNNCKSLEEIVFNDKSNPIGINNMQYMFCNCTKLKILTGLSNWNTEKVVYMNNMFENCESIEKFSDITKWNIENVKDMTNMFENFNKKDSLPSWYKEK